MGEGEFWSGRILAFHNVPLLIPGTCKDVATHPLVCDLGKDLVMEG